jgi:hypothetical protein
MADVLVVSSRLVIVVAPTLASAMFAMSVIEIVDAIKKKKKPQHALRENGLGNHIIRLRISGYQ